MQQSAAFAAYLAHRIEPGDRVACAMRNCAEFFVAWFATVAAGGVVVPVNPVLEADDGRHVLGDSGSVLVVCDGQTRPMVDGCRKVWTTSGRSTEPSPTAWHRMGARAQWTCPPGDRPPSTVLDLQHASVGVPEEPEHRAVEGLV